MVKVIKTLAVENGMNFDDITCFETENYVGMWNYAAAGYALIAKGGTGFSIVDLNNFDNLQDLDDRVYEVCGEHIDEVYDAGKEYTFMLLD